MPRQAQDAAVENLRRVTADVAKINDFIISLIEDPAKLAKFREDPDSALESAGIPQDVGELMKAGDRLTVLRAAGGGEEFNLPPITYHFPKFTVVISPVIGTPAAFEQ